MARRQTKSDGQKALTSIPRRIHCAATEEPEPNENLVDELDEIEINDFIITLAEVALAVAARRDSEGQSGE